MIDTTFDTRVYDLQELPDPVELIQFGEAVGDGDRPILNKGRAYLWSGMWPIPTIGAPVVIKMNGLGPGTVASYFHEAGFLGVKVKLDAPPAWHVKQTAGTKFAGYAQVFGAELKWDVPLTGGI